MSFSRTLKNLGAVGLAGWACCLCCSRLGLLGKLGYNTTVLHKQTAWCHQPASSGGQRSWQCQQVEHSKHSKPTLEDMHSFVRVHTSVRVRVHMLANNTSSVMICTSWRRLMVMHAQRMLISSMSCSHDRILMHSWTRRELHELKAPLFLFCFTEWKHLNWGRVIFLDGN